MKTMASILPRFFTDRLQNQKCASKHTVASYRDTFRLLISFTQERLKKEPVALLLDDFSPELVGDFLSHLETTRENSARTRNARLAAIHSFFRFVAAQEPASLLQAQRVLAIPQKRCDGMPISFLTQPEVEAFLAAPDKTTQLGRRDFTMLLLMVQTGIRVSELVALRVQDVILTTGAHVRCQGKGRKQRCTPLRRQTVAALRLWIEKQALQPADLLFPSRHGTAISRDAVGRRVTAYAQAAAKSCPSLKEKRVTPHVLRHTTAMQLLQARIDTSVIALWLGHESIKSTQAYLHGDLSIKERALAETTAPGVKVPRYVAPDPLLSFLESL